MIDTSHIKFDYFFEMPNQWTFQGKKIYALLQSIIDQPFIHKILVPFGGMTRFTVRADQSITYIDIEDTREKPYILGDCTKIMPIMIEKGEKYDLIISDPPFTFFQMVHMYGNKKMSDMGFCKECYAQLLNKGGEILHFGYNTSGLGNKRGFEKKSITLVNYGGNHNDLLILHEKRM